MHRVVTLLRDLVAIPSVNPAFLPGGDVRTGERRVAAFLEAMARKAGLKVERQPVLNDRSNLLVRTGGGRRSGQVRRLLLAPHMDTVGEPNLDRGLKPVIRAGKLHGRGACDTKGSVAAMFAALLSFAETPRARDADIEIVFAGLVDEENSQKGSRALARSKFKADLAIVGEPTELKLVTAHKGDIWLRLDTSGRSAHGSTPHLGKNAVHEMARVVNLLETDYAALLSTRAHRLLGSPTINVGTISGGAQPNIVPNACHITIDRRTIPGETQQSVIREITSLLKAGGLNATVTDTKTDPCLALETDGNHPEVARFLKLIKQRKAIGVDFFCDAAVLAAGGIPSVVFGPGNIAQAHTADEWIEIDSLVRAHDILLRFMLDFGS